MSGINGLFEAVSEITSDTSQQSELPQASDYNGEKNFMDEFSNALSSFINEIFGTGDMADDTKDTHGTTGNAGGASGLDGADVSDNGTDISAGADTGKDVNTTRGNTGNEGKEVNETLTEKASDAMMEVFDQQTLSEWGKMSLEQRSEKLNEYYETLGQSLGIDAKGVVIEDLYTKVGEGTQGYNSGDGYLHLDYRNLQDPEKLLEVLNTTTHEARHQLQNEAIADPSKFPEISPSLIGEWEHNMQNYDSGNFGYESYYNQGVEVDARAFAGDVLINYKDKMGL